MFVNALRAHFRLRVPTATRIALPSTRGITSLLAFRRAVPKNVSLSVSRSFTTSQAAREQEAPKESEDPGVASKELEDPQVAPKELEDSQVAPKDLVEGGARTPLEAPSKTIFVGNIPHKATEDDIRQTFSQFGEITEIRQRAYFFFPWPFFFNCVHLKNHSSRLSTER